MIFNIYVFLLRAISFLVVGVFFCAAKVVEVLISPWFVDLYTDLLAEHDRPRCRLAPYSRGRRRGR